MLFIAVFVTPCKVSECLSNMACNVHGLLPAVEFKDFSGRAPLQIQFYLWARPTRCRLAANRVLAVVHYLVIKLFELGITEAINTFSAPEFFKYLVKIR